MSGSLGARVRRLLKRLLLAILNPRLLLCVGVAWMITNGWSYVFVGVGALWGIPWMTAVGAAYLGLLWFPFTPEKILTFFIAIGLLRWWFPRDEKTLTLLRQGLAAAKAEVAGWRRQWRRRRRRRHLRRLWGALRKEVTPTK